MPEERNRIEVDALSAHLFAPDERSAATLREEGVAGRDPRRRRRHGGRVGAVRPARARALQDPRPARSRAGRYVLATVHREANVRPERLRRIVEGLGRARRCPLSFPLTPGRRPCSRGRASRSPRRLRVIEPLGYLDFAALASQAAVIATDSGGLQKEAYWYGVPCVTMRPSTEWVDTVEAAQTSSSTTIPRASRPRSREAGCPPSRPALYGDGHASQRVAAVLGGTMPRCAS